MHVSPNLPETTDRHGRKIEVGSRVVSYDFPEVTRDREGPSACYVVGVVVGVETESFNSPRYVIDVERRVFEGEEPEGMVARAPRVFPPLNGIRSWLGGRTDGVELEADVEEEAS